MAIYMGMDGGGTSTTVVLGDAAGREFGRFDLGPSNYHIIGVEALRQFFARVLDEVRNRYQIEAYEVASLAFCGAGIDNETDAAVVKKTIAEAGFQHSIFVANDSLGAIVGANGVEEGAILIAGTGSVALGISEGVIYRVGGWGHLIDDEGSGYWIGKEAIRRVFRAFDGRGQRTALEQALLRQLHCRNVEALLGFIYDEKTQKQHIAELAQLVFDHMDTDPVASQLIDEAAQGLFDMGLTLMRHMDKERLNIKVCGSILLKTETMRKKLLDISESICPSLTFEMPDRDAATGALMLSYLKERRE